MPIPYILLDLLNIPGDYAIIVCDWFEVLSHEVKFESKEAKTMDFYENINSVNYVDDILTPKEKCLICVGKTYEVCSKCNNDEDAFISVSEFIRDARISVELGCESCVSCNKKKCLLESNREILLSMDEDNCISLICMNKVDVNK